MNRAEHLEILCDAGPFPAGGTVECAAVTVGGRATRDAVRAYADTAVRVQTLVDWPSGLGKPTVRQIEAVAAAKDGTHGVQVAAHPAHVIDRDDAGLREDVMGLVIAVREVSRAIAVDVVIDAAWLSDAPDHAEAVCRAVQESGGDGVALAPHRLGNLAYEKCVALMAHHAGPLQIKAMSDDVDPGGVRALLGAGASRIAVAADRLARN